MQRGERQGILEKRERHSASTQRKVGVCGMTRDGMIDEYWTWIFYGYHSDELSHSSHKSVVVRCGECCQYRVLPFQGYRDLCRSCSKTKKYLSESTINKMSIAGLGRPVSEETSLKLSIIGKRKIFTEEWCRKISKAKKGKKMPPFTDEHRHNMSEASKGATFAKEHRQHLSAGQQGIPYDDWIGFSDGGEYCEKFDEACRERIREKYNRLCYVCDKNEESNNQKLSVHHADMNKSQGCNGNEWKLVPLCRSCHAKAHFNPSKSRIVYILNTDVQ